MTQKGNSVPIKIKQEVELAFFWVQRFKKKRMLLTKIHLSQYYQGIKLRFKGIIHIMDNLE